jgi:hypothetical protein
MLSSKVTWPTTQDTAGEPCQVRRRRRRRRRRKNRVTEWFLIDCMI